jgi:hypothetical protein
MEHTPSACYLNDGFEKVWTANVTFATEAAGFSHSD